jgi:hypothetical protein
MRFLPVFLILSTLFLPSYLYAVDFINPPEGYEKERIFSLKSYEECHILGLQQSLEFSFYSPDELHFNIHYHAGGKTYYLRTEESVSHIEDVFIPSFEYEYCLMWENKSREPKIILHQINITEREEAKYPLDNIEFSSKSN